MNETYLSIRGRIEERLKEFKDLWERGDREHAFAELAFCIFTPQSSAKSCWSAILALKEKDLLLHGTAQEVHDLISRVRFRKRKSLFLLEARKLCESFDLKEKMEGFKDSYERREWLVKNIKGYGYKEASHFLRNIGLAEDLAILDRHILKNLLKNGVIESIPKSITRSQYLDIEKRMQAFSSRIGIPMQHLDFLFWYMEAGDVFK